MKMDSKDSSENSAFDYDAMRRSLLGTTYDDLGTAPPAENGIKKNVLNPGVLGKSEMKIPVPWGHVAAKTWGNARTGRKVLAVHGWMDNAGTFDRLVPLLPQDLYIIAIDVPGHGLSSHLPAGCTYHYIDFVTSIKRVVIHLGWEKKKFIYMAHSMGSSLGLMFASLFPSTIERFVSLDLLIPLTDPSEDIPSRLTGGICTFLTMDALEIKETKEPPMYDLDEAVDRLMKYTLYSDYPLTETAAKTLLIRGSRPVTECGKVVFTRDQRLQTANFLRFTPETMLSILRNIKCHLLIIRAQQSLPVNKLLRDKAINVYQQKCASFKLIEVPGNHFVHLNQPEAVAKYVVEFLDKDFDKE